MKVGMEFAAAGQVLALRFAKIDCESTRQAQKFEMGEVHTRFASHGVCPRGLNAHRGDKPRGSQDKVHIENELPQPQVPLACGFVMLKPRLFKSSWKSTVTPDRYNRLRLSITTGTL